MNLGNGKRISDCDEHDRLCHWCQIKISKEMLHPEREVLQPVLRLMLMRLPGHLVPSKQVTFPGHLNPRQNFRLRIC